MLRTTYFAKVKSLPQDLNFVSIARKTPPGFPGKVCMKLAPSSSTLWNIKQTGDEEAYRKDFAKQLSNLDPHELVEEYGEDAVWTCYEGEGKFCHRHMVADWFRSYGYEVKEL